MNDRHRVWTLAAVCLAVGSVAIFSCVGDSTDTSQSNNTGDESEPCFANGTCSSGLTCVSKVCVNLAGDAVAPLDAAVADTFAPGVDASDAGTALQDSGSTVDAGPFCDQTDAAYCEDFDHGRTLAQVGNAAVTAGSATLTIDSTNPISAPSSLVARMDGGVSSQNASVTHDFGILLGSFKMISADADFRCTVPTSEIAGLPLGFFFYTDPSYSNGHQVLAALYPDKIRIDEGLWAAGALTGTGNGTELAFDCTTPATHHITLTIQSAVISTPPYTATLSLDGKTSVTQLSSGANGFAFSPQTLLLLAAQNNFNGTAMTLTVDNVVVRTN